MFTEEEKLKVKDLYAQVMDRIKNLHIGVFENVGKPLFLISTAYPGVWLEHVYDSIMYAKLEKDGIELAKNTINAFFKFQKEDGQLPCFIWNKGAFPPGTDVLGYSQLQECTSFTKLCLDVYDMTGDAVLLSKAYDGCVKWDKWLCENRMTMDKGLVEMFCGYDTGHDNSGRLEGLTCKGNYAINNARQNASILPPDDDIVPILAPDINSIFYASRASLSKMAKILGKEKEALLWSEKAEEVKKRLFEICYDEEDKFFYDVDKHGNKRKYLSISITNLYSEKVLDPVKDKALADEIYEKHLKNPEEFWTKVPFPSMAVSDPSWKKHRESNCWGYYSQALTALRCTKWMDDYGKSKDFEKIMEIWVKAWTDFFDKVKFGQELDPLTGEPSSSSEWYSSCMLLYAYSARRLGLI